MRSECFLDTNVLLHAVRNGPDCDLALDGFERGGITSVQVLSEFTMIARDMLGRSWTEINQAVSLFKILCPKPLPVQMSTYEVAVDLLQQEALTPRDALIAASALLAGCRWLLSDMATDGRVISKQVTVRNPFGCDADERPIVLMRARYHRASRPQ